jgi:hypothetical protein
MLTHVRFRQEKEENPEDQVNREKLDAFVSPSPLI